MPKRTKPSTEAAETPKLTAAQGAAGPAGEGTDDPGRSGSDVSIAEESGDRAGDECGDEPAPGLRAGRSKPEGQSNQRNGSSGKTVLTDDGPVRIEVPRDRHGSYEPMIIGKHERRFTGFDQKIIAMYARGMTVREIQGYLAEMYAHGGVPRLHQQGHR